MQSRNHKNQSSRRRHLKGANKAEIKHEKGANKNCI